MQTVCLQYHTSSHDKVAYRLSTGLALICCQYTIRLQECTSMMQDIPSFIAWEDSPLGIKTDRYRDDSPLGIKTDRYRDDSPLGIKTDRYRDDSPLGIETDRYRDDSPLRIETDRYNGDVNDSPLGIL